MTGPVTASGGERPDPGALHRDAFVFDGHNDMALRLLDGADPRQRAPSAHLDLPRMREGGLDGGIFAVWVDPGAPDPRERTLDRVGRTREIVEETPGLRLVLSPSELERAEDEGDVAVVLGVEGAYAVRDQLSTVDRLHDLGVRCVTLTWMEPTPWADAAGAAPVHGGLTAFGARVVDRLQRRGVLVDVSHAADSTVREVLDRADRPVVASHSACRALADHPRNLPDELVERMAASGGLVGINFFPGYLDEARGRRFDELRSSGMDLFSPGGREAMAAATDGLPPVGLDRVARHAAHAARVGGMAAVGLGSDFDGVPTLPEGMSGVEDLPALTRALAGAGLDGSELRGVLGENFRRVLRETLA